MLIRGTNKDRYAVSGKVLDEHQGGGRDQNLLVEIAKARIQGCALDDPQQRRKFPGEKRGVNSEVYCCAIEEFRMRSEHNNSPNAGQNFLQ